MQLIISGNPNLDTIRGVLYFSNQFSVEKYETPITKVTFIDNEGSIVDENKNNIEGNRSKIARYYLNNSAIESIFIEKDKLHREIPKIIAEKLKTYGHSDLIVDLTSGDKFISSALYASASLSQIRNLFFLFVSFDKRKKLPEELAKGDYQIEVISPLEEIEDIGRNTYFDIVYYKEKVENILVEFRGVIFQSSFLNNMLSAQLYSCIDNYFLHKYPESINGIGQLIEEISLELSKRIKIIYSLDVEIASNFNGSIDWLLKYFCKPLKKDESFFSERRLQRANTYRYNTEFD